MPGFDEKPDLPYFRGVLWVVGGRRDSPASVAGGQWQIVMSEVGCGFNDWQLTTSKGQIGEGEPERGKDS